MNTQRNSQQIFEQMVVGTLIYSVVIGFFNDYTDLLATRSYSTTFALAIVLQILTFLTLTLKKHVKRFFEQRPGRGSRLLMAFSIWLIMFLSKFVFLAVIDWVLGSRVEVRGFLAIMIVVATMVIAQYVIDRISAYLSP